MANLILSPSLALSSNSSEISGGIGGIANAVLTGLKTHQIPAPIYSLIPVSASSNDTSPNTEANAINRLFNSSVVVRDSMMISLPGLPNIVEKMSETFTEKMATTAAMTTTNSNSFKSLTRHWLTSSSTINTPRLLTHSTFNYNYNLSSTSVTVLNKLEPHKDYAAVKHDARVYFTCFIYAFVFTFGILGNSCVLYIILKYPKMKTVTNLYIFNLALADIMFLIGIPILMTTMITNNWQFGYLVCKLYWVTANVNQYVSSIFYLVLSGDRFVAVYLALTIGRKYRNPFIAKCVCAGIWLFSMLLMIPVMKYARQLHIGINPLTKRHQYSCQVIWPNPKDSKFFRRFGGALDANKIFTLYTFLFGYGIPVLCTGIFYFFVLLKMKQIGPRELITTKKPIPIVKITKPVDTTTSRSLSLNFAASLVPRKFTAMFGKQNDINFSTTNKKVAVNSARSNYQNRGAKPNYKSLPVNILPPPSEESNNHFNIENNNKESDDEELFHDDEPSRHSSFISSCFKIFHRTQKGVTTNVGDGDVGVKSIKEYTFEDDESSFMIQSPNSMTLDLTAEHTNNTTTPIQNVPLLGGRDIKNRQKNNKTHRSGLVKGGSLKMYKNKSLETSKGRNSMVTSTANYGHTSNNYAAQNETQGQIQTIKAARGGSNFHIRKSSHHIGESALQKRKRRNIRRVTLMVMTVIAVYVFCWTPYWILQLLISFNENPLPEYFIYMALFVYCLAYANSTMNPILYAFLSDNFKTGFIETFKKPIGFFRSIFTSKCIRRCCNDQSEVTSSSINNRGSMLSQHLQSIPHPNESCYITESEQKRNLSNSKLPTLPE